LCDGDKEENVEPSSALVVEILSEDKDKCNDEKEPHGGAMEASDSGDMEIQSR
jgi:hypothetical protein